MKCTADALAGSLCSVLLGQSFMNAKHNQTRSIIACNGISKPTLDNKFFIHISLPHLPYLFSPKRSTKKFEFKFLKIFPLSIIANSRLYIQGKIKIHVQLSLLFSHFMEKVLNRVEISHETWYNNLTFVINY